MASIDFRFTTEKPLVLIRGLRLQFLKMHIATGKIDDVYFRFLWKEKDDKNDGDPISHYKDIGLNSYVHPYQAKSETDFEFRDYDPRPMVRFEENLGGVSIAAISKSNTPFDVTAHVVIDDSE